MVSVRGFDAINVLGRFCIHLHLQSGQEGLAANGAGQVSEYEDVLAECYCGEYRAGLCSADVAGARHCASEATTKAEDCACWRLLVGVLVSLMSCLVALDRC